MNCLASLKQLRQWAAFFKNIEGAAGDVGGGEVVDAHGVVDGMSDVFRAHHFLGGVLGEFVGLAAGLAAVEGATTAAAREPVVAATWAVWNDQQSSEARCGHTVERDARCSEVPPIMQVDEICHARERWSFPQAKG